MADKINMREAALDFLLDIEKNGRLSHIAMGEAMLRLQFAPKQERAFFTRLCEGTLERRIYLDYTLDAYSKTKMKKCKPLIRNLLRLSAYQILFMQVPDAAACNEAVTLVKKRGFRNLAGFVNGVLRTLARAKENLPLPERKNNLPEYCSVRYSVPKWLTEFLAEQYGWEKTEKMLGAFLQAKPLTVRACLLKTTPEELKSALEENGAAVEPGAYFPYALRISGVNYLNKIPPFREGLFVVQDESSMLPVAVANIQKGERALDLCAAPGGKTFHAADCVGEKGQVIARDLTEYKIDLLKENNDRIKYPWITVQQWDARCFDPALENAVDVALADLPCSGLGIMGRKNDIKYRITKEQMEDLVKLQRQILSRAWKYVKPGGRLIFSTCTLNKKENEENVRWIEENTPLSLASIERELPEKLRGRTGKKGYLQLIPGIDDCDGFFVSKFIRRQ